MLRSEEIYFLKYFFSCNAFGKWTAQERLFHIDLDRTVSHKYHEVFIVSKICSLGHLCNTISTSLRSGNSSFHNIDLEFVDAPIDGVV